MKISSGGPFGVARMLDFEDRGVVVEVGRGVGFSSACAFRRASVFVDGSSPQDLGHVDFSGGTDAWADCSTSGELKSGHENRRAEGVTACGCP